MPIDLEQHEHPRRNPLLSPIGNLAARIRRRMVADQVVAFLVGHIPRSVRAGVVRLQARLRERHPDEQEPIDVATGAHPVETDERELVIVPAIEPIAAEGARQRDRRPHAVLLEEHHPPEIALPDRCVLRRVALAEKLGYVIEARILLEERQVVPPIQEIEEYAGIGRCER